MITEQAKYLTRQIYKIYGSSTGYLFDIPPFMRGSVEAIVQCVLDEVQEEEPNGQEDRNRNDPARIAA